MDPVSLVVVQGDCLSSIAVRFGHFWQTVWNAPENEELRKQRANPGVLLPGDRVFVPALVPKVLPAATGRRHTFRRKGVPSELVIRFFYGGVPRASAPYRLLIDGSARPNGALDADGWLRVPIPSDAAAAEVIVGEGETELAYRVILGGLDPVTEPTGVQARLDHLGFASLADFQKRHALPAGDEADEASRAKLLELHGS